MSFCFFTKRRKALFLTVFGFSIGFFIALSLLAYEGVDIANVPWLSWLTYPGVIIFFGVYEPLSVVVHSLVLDVAFGILVPIFLSCLYAVVVTIIIDLVNWTASKRPSRRR